MNIVEIPEIKVELQGVFGDDRWIAEAAWTSSLKQENKALRTDEDVKRVINLLANEKHSVPFESVVFRFWIRMPISTDRQLFTDSRAPRGCPEDIELCHQNGKTLHLMLKRLHKRFSVMAKNMGPVI